MRLIAKIRGVHAQIDCLLNYRGILAPFPVTMILDTGASCSCLLPDHVHYFRIPYQELTDADRPINTASGIVTPKILPNVDLILPLKTGLNYSQAILWKIFFDEFQILPPPRKHIPQPRHRVVSIIGMDVLKDFKKWLWDWNSSELVLDE